jgi:hypothetical protein
MEKQLCLLWQNVSSGQRYHIGDLTLKESGTYAFKYNTVESAVSPHSKDAYK